MLPKIEVPIYDLQLLSIKDKIKFRPFSVKEEKLFLMAQESEDDGKQETILNTVKQVVNNCLVTELNIDNLPTFDLEYLFLNLRAKSVGEEVELSYNCNNTYVKEVDGKKEEIADITRINGLEWQRSSMPRLKQASSPTFEHQTTMKPINKGKTNTLKLSQA